MVIDRPMVFWNGRRSAVYEDLQIIVTKGLTKSVIITYTRMVLFSIREAYIIKNDKYHKMIEIYI